MESESVFSLFSCSDLVASYWQDLIFVTVNVSESEGEIYSSSLLVRCSSPYCTLIALLSYRALHTSGKLRNLWSVTLFQTFRCFNARILIKNRYNYQCNFLGIITWCTMRHSGRKIKHGNIHTMDFVFSSWTDKYQLMHYPNSLY
jgi:hypothetical protein